MFTSVTGTLKDHMSETSIPLGAIKSPTSKVVDGDLPPIDLEKLEATLEYIRPAIQMDGGDIILTGVEGGEVNIQMVGACGGCPMSMMTLKAGIERILRDRVPGVETVNATA